MSQRRQLLCLLLLVPLLAQAEIYRWVDENGKTVYSDRPREGAKRIDLPPLTTYEPGKEQRSTSSGNGAANEKQEIYKSLSITRPANDHTFVDNTGTVAVDIAISPALRPTDEIVLQLDDASVSIQATGYTFENVFRGTHTLKASVVDRLGNTLITSSPVVFHVRRHSILQKKPKAP